MNKLSLVPKRNPAGWRAFVRSARGTKAVVCLKGGGYANQREREVHFRYGVSPPEILCSLATTYGGVDDYNDG